MHTAFGRSSNSVTICREQINKQNRTINIIINKVFHDSRTDTYISNGKTKHSNSAHLVLDNNYS